MTKSKLLKAKPAAGIRDVRETVEKMEGVVEAARRAIEGKARRPRREASKNG